MIEKLSRATPRELQLWMLSALVFGTGIGVLFASYLNLFVWWLIGISALMHGWAMYRIYRRT